MHLVDLTVGVSYISITLYGVKRMSTLEKTST